MNENQKITAPTKDKQEQSIKYTEVTISAESVNIKEDKINIKGSNEVKTLEIDFARDILKVNGANITNRPVIVTLPGVDGWKKRKMFNAELATGNPEELDLLEVEFDINYINANNKPL